MADPAEIAAVAAFLASQDSSFMTASEVAVDGGLAQLRREVLVGDRIRYSATSELTVEDAYGEAHRAGDRK